MHREVRKYVQSFVRPGVTLVDMCKKLEAKGLELLGAKGDLSCGWGFPTGGENFKKFPPFLYHISKHL